MPRKDLVYIIRVISITVLAGSVSACALLPPAEATVEVPVDKNLKAAWIYEAPIGAAGWSHAHDIGRKYVEDKFPWLKTVYVEDVPEADVGRYIDRFIVQEGVDVVFTTSFGYMDATLEAGNRYPDKIFLNASGYKRAPNVGTYFAEFYQLYYLSGLMAGALTKTNKIGYVAAHPIPAVISHIDAYALGVKEVNPEATIHVRWLFAWYDPAQAKLAAEALIAVGCDVLAFTEDSPTIVQVGQEYVENGESVYTIGHTSPMLKFGPDSIVSAPLLRWGVIYEDILAKIYTGAYTPENMESVDYWWMLREGAVELGVEFGIPINPKFEPALKEKTVVDPVLGEISVYHLIIIRQQQMSEERVLFDPFTGPIKDQEGVVRIEAGGRATHDELWTLDWFVDGIVDKIPR